MLVSCKEDSRKSAHGKRNARDICQAARVLFTFPVKTTVPSTCFTKNKAEKLHMYNVAQEHDNNRTGGREGGWWRLASGAE